MYVVRLCTHRYVCCQVVYTQVCMLSGCVHTGMYVCCQVVYTQVCMLSGSVHTGMYVHVCCQKLMQSLKSLFITKYSNLHKIDQLPVERYCFHCKTNTFTTEPNDK